MRVLIVDDDSNIRECFKMLLETIGKHETLEATSGETAQYLVDTFKPDLIISDHVMSGMNGLELIKTIRDKGCNAYFSLISANTSKELASDALGAGANDVIAKPFNIKDLEITLAKAELQISKPCKSLAELESETIRRAIDSTPTLKDAARMLGIDTATLWRKRKARST